MNNCYNGYFINVSEGYWRPNNYTDLIDQCINKAENC